MSLEGLNGVQSLYCDPSDFNWHLHSVATSSRGGWGWEQYAPLTLFLSQSWNGFGGGCGTGGVLLIAHRVGTVLGVVQWRLLCSIYFTLPRLRNELICLI